MPRQAPGPKIETETQERTATEGCTATEERTTTESRTATADDRGGAVGTAASVPRGTSRGTSRISSPVLAGISAHTPPRDSRQESEIPGEVEGAQAQSIVCIASLAPGSLVCKASLCDIVIAGIQDSLRLLACALQLASITKGAQSRCQVLIQPLPRSTSRSA